MSDFLACRISGFVFYLYILCIKCICIYIYIGKALMSDFLARGMVWGLGI